ncbi:hypothetical protein [Pseudoflavonifractor sp. MSJ-37]|uniref:hypothetical protein n=1 Tax=Pseudoflavonifractor sp. MSJ-37 TaxID=2841531 RepID=UPI001C0F5AAE|nr:hypothetical protein [Pseudoflavonifractor sp. MSJ-37]MBU5434967.1 hypothetical protein [Pseudoflavonifractor sp. MSJ-37]
MRRAGRVCAVLLAGAALAGAGLASAAGGSADDPLISLSYLTDTFLPGAVAQAGDRMDAKTKQTYDAALSALTSAYQADLAAGQSGGGGLADGRYKQGDAIRLSSGSGAMLLAGSAKLSFSGGAVVDVTAGTTAASGQAMTAVHRYLAAEGNGAVVTVTSETAVLEVEGDTSATLSSSTDYNALAAALQKMGLFSGTGTAYGSGYDLEKAPTRIEGLIMFLRLMGEEQAAAAYTGACPFADVPEWAQKYAAYAAQKGYTAGVGPAAAGGQAFAPARTVGAAEYMTFLLRALGYTDSGDAPDFTWQTALPKAAGWGVITSGEYATLTDSTFRRAHVAYLSYFGLDAPCRGGNTLLAALSASGALDGDQVGVVRNSVKVSRIV